MAAEKTPAKIQPTAREGTSFQREYFLANKRNENERMKQRARRQALAKERSEIPEEKAWQEILRLLERESPSGAEDYTKRMETIRLPEGIFAKWMLDPGESILEVMQRTGSHVQVIPGKQPGLFSSLTLLGKPDQNAAAKKLLQESNLLAAVSEADLNASKSLADYHLRSEISDRHGQTWKRPDDIEKADSLENDQLDDIDLAQLESAVSLTTGRAPTRAVWSNSPPEERERLIKQRISRVEKDLTALNSTLPVSATAFTALVEQLTVDRPRNVWQKNMRRSNEDHESIRDELVAMLTRPENANKVTPLATAMALRYLTRHMYFPAVREILNALKDVKLQLGAHVFNTLLDAAAKDENVVAFHYAVNMMRSRGVTPDAGTWIAFHTLMLKRFPADAERVVARMQANAVQANLSARIDSLESYSAILLASFMDAYPNAEIKDFVENMKRDMPGVKWLTSFSANTMCHFLLKRGSTLSAFEVVDEVVRNGGRPDVITLNTFLTAATRDGNMEMAVAVLRKFRDLHTKSHALASISGQPPTILPRVHDLSISPNNISFRLLCQLAWQRKNFNCLRVFWRYACCAGHVHFSTVNAMRASTTSKGACIGLASTREDDGSPRAHMWSAWAAKFAIGVKAGLGGAPAAQVLSTVRGIKESDLENTENTGAAQERNIASRIAHKTATRRRFKILESDPPRSAISETNTISC